MDKRLSPNRLYFGDCLEVMTDFVPDDSVDLTYLDPPFNSKRIYNAFFGGAQWVAFDDTWRWREAIDDFHAVARDVSLGPTMEGLRAILGESGELAYLSYVANAGRYQDKWLVIAIYTIEDCFAGRLPDLPIANIRRP